MATQKAIYSNINKSQPSSHVASITYKLRVFNQVQQFRVFLFKQINFLEQQINQK